MPAGSHRFQVGSITCTALSDGYCCYPTDWFFPNADREELNRALDSRRLPRESILSPYTCLLVETGRHVILVDTGAGESMATTGAIPARLEMEGIRARDVDTVVLTHAHPDHVGGAVDTRTRPARPAFPNARYIVSEAEIEFWMDPHRGAPGLSLPEEVQVSMRAAARRSLDALRYNVEPIDCETEIVPGVRAVPAPGHTPGHLAVLISSEGIALLDMGDAAVHPLHLENPEWRNGFDSAPDAAAATRRTLAERAGAAGVRVMAFHFPFPSVGRIAARPQGGWEWSPGW
jgi:glyoxylase-like metal-dependent hydrolase (beta-lactamase superfamily II)